MQMVGSAPQLGQPFTCLHLFFYLGGPSTARTFTVDLPDIFNSIVCDQQFPSPQQLCNASPLFFFMYFLKIVSIDFWSGNKMKCCLLEQEFDILSYAAWIPFIGFS
jgi:hypothetical protein